jgi:hypothetical protein
MRAPLLILYTTLAAAGGIALPARAADPPAPPPSAAPANERVVASVDGSWLSENHGGGGAAATYLTNLGQGNVVGLGAEYQTIANAHWTLGTLSGAATLPTRLKLNLYGDLREGAGDIGTHAFHYSVVDGGLFATIDKWTLQLEERHIDIDQSHGHLPKVGLALRLTQALIASVSYAHSYGGNLGTRLTTLRLDYVSKDLTWLAGGAWGPAAPAVINLVGEVVQPGPTLKEQFIGVGLPFGRTEWLLVGDHQDLAGFKRTTLTLTCTLHLGAGG